MSEAEEKRKRLIEMEALKVIDFALTLTHSIPALERAMELIRGCDGSLHQPKNQTRPADSESTQT